ncbi:MAG: hypothetical protein K1W21_00290 [Oscillospiraceae bacterium]
MMVLVMVGFLLFKFGGCVLPIAFANSVPIRFSRAARKPARLMLRMLRSGNDFRPLPVRPLQGRNGQAVSRRFFFAAQLAWVLLFKKGSCTRK